MIFETQKEPCRAPGARAAVIWAFVASLAAAGAAAEGVVLYSETFDADLGTAIAVNDAAASNAWHFRDDCVPNPLPGHSAPGAARWGRPTSCDDFGVQGSSDDLDIPAIDLAACSNADATLTLTFNYFLSLEESSSYDRARVEAVVDGGPPIGIADNGFGGTNAGLGNLLATSQWLTLTSELNGLLGTGDSLVIRFVGETEDGIANLGAGFLVDDVALVCDTLAVDMAVTQTAETALVVPGQLLGYQVTVTHEPMLKAAVLYSVSTSDDLGGPAVDFEDISTIGTLINLSDDVVGGPFPIGFDFPFFGVVRTGVYVSSNGFLTFLPGQSDGCCSGGVLPSPVGPNGVIAGWWADLNPSAGGQVRFATRDLAPNRRFIVQFTGVPHFFNGLPVTFQIKLFESDGRIEIHFQDAPSNGTFHTVGIEDDAGLAAVQFFRGRAALATPLAVRFSPGTPEKASGVTIVDVLPAESIFSSAIPSQGACATTGAAIGETVTCVLGDLEPGAVATVDLEVTVPVAVERPLGNKVTVSADQLEVDPADNTSTLYLPVEGPTGSLEIFSDGFESGDTSGWSAVQ